MCADLARRFRAPCGKVTFYAHLLFGVVLCGGAGVFLVFLKSPWHMSDVSAALLAYFPALLGGAALQFTGESQPYLRSFAFIALAVLTPVAFVVAKTDHLAQLIWALVGTVLSILLWWVANGEDKRFDDVTAQSALGGDDSATLSKSNAQDWQI